MLTWVQANWVTILVVAAVAALIAGAVFSLVRDKKKGKCACGSACEHCAMAGKCHKK